VVERVSPSSTTLYTRSETTDATSLRLTQRKD